MVDVEFFWDPGCPWAWMTSRWVVNVMAERPLEVDWRFLSLRILNEDKDYRSDFPRGYRHRHTRGLKLLRVADAVRSECGREAVLPLYSAFGRIIHVEKRPEFLDQQRGIEKVLADLGYPQELASAAASRRRDAQIRSDTEEALERCGGNIGTPVVSFSPPHGPAFFGPVISRAPRGQEALDLWDAVVVLGRNPDFSELKRSNRGSLQFDDDQD